MNKKKRFLVLLSFIVGTVMFATTAIADIASKSSYEQFKDSIKTTLESLTGGVESFKYEGAHTIKIDDFVLESESDTEKVYYVNFKNKNILKVTKDSNGGNYYSYNEKNIQINWSPDSDNYYLYRYNNQNDNRDYHYKFDNPYYKPGPLENPFKEEGAKDFERIIDAFVGNLKDHVIVVQNEDGSKSFSGSLRDSQIPALINALTSYLAKRSMVDNNYGYNESFYDYKRLPKLVDNIYVKSIRGDAKTNEQGIINDFNASLVLTGDDEDGQQHTLTMEVVFKVSGINSTVVERPDITGKTIGNQVNPDFHIEAEIPQKYVGKWKNDIVIDENDSFEKIGERILEIKSIDSEYVYGEFHSEYMEGYEGEPEQFEFKAMIIAPNHAIIELDDGTESNQKPEDVPEPETIERELRVKGIEPANEIGSIRFENSIIRFHMNYSQQIDEPIFTRVFDE